MRRELRRRELRRKLYTGWPIKKNSDDRPIKKTLNNFLIIGFIFLTKANWIIKTFLIIRTDY